MTQQYIGVGAEPNDGQGTPIRNAFIITNENFSELYARAQVEPPTTLIGSLGDQPGWYAYSAEYFYYCFAAYDGTSVIWAQVTQVGNVTVNIIQNGSSNIKVALNGNATTSVGGIPNVVVVSGSGQSVTGNITASGNIRASYLLGDGSQLTGLPASYTNSNVTTLLAAFGSNTISSTANITGGNINGGNIVGTYILGNGSQLTGLPASYTNSNVTTLLAAFGSNTISSTANITGGNINGGSIFSAGNIDSGSQVNATGNITTQGYFVGNFIGNIVANITNVPGPGGAVLFNDGAGNVAATAGLVFNNSGPNVLTVIGSYSATGNVTGNYLNGNGAFITGLPASYSNANVSSFLASFGSNTISTTGNITGSNILTNGIVSATSTITGGNLATGGQASIGGNISGGNIYSPGIISGVGTVSGGNLNASSQVSAGGNVAGANILTSGQVTATGNVTGNYLRATLDINAGGNVSATSHTGTTVSVTGNVTGGNITTAGTFSAGNLSASGNITSAGGVQSGTGFLAQTAYTGPYSDGIILDYVTGNGRISSGSNDGLQFYNQGLATAWLGGFTADGTFSATGNVSGGQNLTVGNLTISAATISSSTQQITLGALGNVGNVIIAGNLQVLGNTTTINSNSITTNDLVIYTANNASDSSMANGSGLGIGPSGTFGTFLYNNISNVWATGLGISATGNITSGNVSATNHTGTAVNVSGAVTVNSSNGATAIVNGGTNGSGNIGSSGAAFDTVYAKATTAQYADLAENYASDADYAPGTVVIFGGNKEITVSTDVADERVAGAISTEPAHLMNAEMAGLPVALRGRIPVNVIGPVTKGDSLVTSPTAGYAQSVGRSRLYGQAVFAKALETNLEDGEKLIIAVIL